MSIPAAVRLVSVDFESLIRAGITTLAEAFSNFTNNNVVRINKFDLSLVEANKMRIRNKKVNILCAHSKGGEEISIEITISGIKVVLIENNGNMFLNICGKQYHIQNNKLMSGEGSEFESLTVTYKKYKLACKYDLGEIILELEGHGECIFSNAGDDTLWNSYIMLGGSAGIFLNGFGFCRVG